MKRHPKNSTQINPITYFRHLIGARRERAVGRGLRYHAAKFGFIRLQRGPQNVDQAFQALLLNPRGK